MKRSSLMKLRTPEWVPVEGLDGLEVQVVAANSADIVSALFNPNTSPAQLRAVVSDAIHSFRGYTDDDGKDLPNTRQHREELAGVAAVRFAVQAHLLKAQGELTQGEESAASDSLSTQSHS